MHSVLGLLSVLEDSANLTPSERESLTTIRNSGEDLQTVISNVLDISKIQAGGIVAESIPLDLRNRASRPPTRRLRSRRGPALTPALARARQ